MIRLLESILVRNPNAGRRRCLLTRPSILDSSSRRNRSVILIHTDRLGTRFAQLSIVPILWASCRDVRQGRASHAALPVVRCTRTRHLRAVDSSFPGHALPVTHASLSAFPSGRRLPGVHHRKPKLIRPGSWSPALFSCCDAVQSGGPGLVDPVRLAPVQLGQMVEDCGVAADACCRRPDLDDEVADLRLGQQRRHAIPARPSRPRIEAEDLAAPRRWR